MEEQMKKIALTLVAALVLFGASEAVAQTVAGTATIEIPTLLNIGVSNVTVAFPTPVLADWDAGQVGMSSGTSVVSTRANITHRVTIHANAANMSGPVGTTKPASDLQWGTAGTGGSFFELATGAANVVSSLNPGTHASAAEVWYRMAIDETSDVPGTYSLAFTYTIVAN
jgi:hypothetical protein